MSSPERLILISWILIGQKASRNSKDCVYVLSTLGFFCWIGVEWPKSINHTCLVGQDREEKLIFGMRQSAYTVVLPHVPLLFAFVQWFFPPCSRKAGCRCAFLVSTRNTTPKPFITEQEAPGSSQNRYGIIEL